MENQLIAKRAPGDPPDLDYLTRRELPLTGVAPP